MSASPVFRVLAIPGDDLAHIYEAFLLIRRGLSFALRPVRADHLRGFKRRGGGSILAEPLVLVLSAGDGPAELGLWFDLLPGALAKKRETGSPTSPCQPPALSVIVPDRHEPEMSRFHELRELGAHLITAPADAMPADIACRLWPTRFPGPTADLLAALPTHLSPCVRLAIANGVAMSANCDLTEQDMALGCGCGSDLHLLRRRFEDAGLDRPASWIPHLRAMARSPNPCDLLSAALERCSAEPHPHQPPPSIPPLPEPDAPNVRKHLAELRRAAVGKAKLLPVPSSDVEDVAQEALLKVLRGKANASILQITPALVRCAVQSVVTDSWRAAQQSSHLQADRLDDFGQISDTRPLPDQQHERALVRPAFVRSLESLAEPARTVVWLALDRGWCPGDIALLLGKTPGAIATTISRAIPVVREAISPYRQSWR